MFKLTISRKEWWRGKYNSRLLLENGCRCCIGIYGKAIGVPDEMMLGTRAPNSNRELADKFVECGGGWLVKIHEHRVAVVATGTSLSLMGTNDDEGRAESLREEQIEEYFAKYGVQVTFVD